MSTITSVKLWRDPGFTEGCLEVPRIGSVLPSPDLEYESSYNPSVSDIFSRIKLRALFTSVLSCSYLSIELDMNSGLKTNTFYGWIDSVSLISDSSKAPLIEINWHVDLWRTYVSDCVAGSGIVSRRASDGNEPPQSYPFRYMIHDGSYQTIADDANGYWYVVFTFNYQYTLADSRSITETRYGYFPITYPSTTVSVGDYTAPTFDELIQGKWDELLGMAPETVKGIFLSPIKPGEGWKPAKNGGGATRGYYWASSMSAFSEYRISIDPFHTDDITTYEVVGFDGESVGSFPWGFEVSGLEIRIVMGSSASYLQIRGDSIYSHLEGVCFTIPLVPIELTENSWSSYVYSGARQADMDQRKAETEKSLESGLVSTSTSAVSGAASGALMGSIGGPIGALGGATIGGVTSAFGQAVSTVTDYAIGSKYNDRFQSIEDYRRANQLDGLLMAGSGFDCVKYGIRPSIIRMVKDPYSVSIRNKDIELYGVHVNEPVESFQELLSAGGPLQVSNATIKGPIPVEAKQYIRNRLAQGVRMI